MALLIGARRQGVSSHTSRACPIHPLPAAGFRSTPTRGLHTSKNAARSRRRVQTAALFDFIKRIQPGSLVKSAESVQLGPLQVGPMGLGTWAWGNQLLWGYEEGMDSELQQVFNLAISNGVNLFDTADSYGTGKLQGRSEELLGQFSREAPGRLPRPVHIATKLAPYPWRVTPGQFVAACRGSLRRTGLEKLSLGQLHWSTANYQPFQERALWDGLAALYDEGLVEAVGVSNYGPKQLQRIYDYLSKRGIPLVSCQVQFSLVSRGPAQMATKAACDDLGMKLIAYSPLGLGMLTGKYGPGEYPSGPRGLLFRQIVPGLEGTLEVMREIGEQRYKTLPQIAINWCICQGTIPIPGAKNVAQMQSNLGALGWKLDSGELAEINAAADQAPRGMLQNIFQTS